MKKCPVCGVQVKVDNLERHLRNRHPNANVDLDLIITREERRQAQRKAAPARPVVTPRGFRVVLGVAMVLAIILALVLLNPFRSVGPNVGQIAPDFSAPSSSGGTVSLSSYRGTPVLLLFMDVDCSFCQEETRETMRYVYENYSSRVEFLSVSVNFVGAEDTPDRINEFRASYRTPWVYLLDENRRVASTYGVSSTPRAFVVSRDGVILETFRGLTQNGIAVYSAALNRAVG